MARRDRGPTCGASTRSRGRWRRSTARARCRPRSGLAGPVRSVSGCFRVRAMSDRTQPGSAYRAAGVDYGTLDAGKRNALTEALATSAMLGGPRRGGGRRVPRRAGVCVRARRTDVRLRARGARDEVGDRAAARGSRSAPTAFAAVAYDTVAAIVNDLICIGALPLVVNAYFATGSSGWYEHAARQSALLAGWREGCEHAGATWGGGESPSLPDLVARDEIELAGCAVGVVPGGGPGDPR